MNKIFDSADHENYDLSYHAQYIMQDIFQRIEAGNYGSEIMLIVHGYYAEQPEQPSVKLEADASMAAIYSWLEVVIPSMQNIDDIEVAVYIKE